MVLLTAYKLVIKKMVSYASVADVRLMHVNFTSDNIHNDNITQFIENAEKNINSMLGITTDLTSAEIAKYNVEETALLYAAIDCCNYDPSTLFANTSEFAMQLDAFYAKLELAKQTLIKMKGTAVAPAALFRPQSTSQ